MPATPSIETTAGPLWQAACGRLDISGTNVHILRVDLTLQTPRVSELGQTLSADERARAGRFISKSDADIFIARRGILREILGCQLQIAPVEVGFSYGSHGKPSVSQPDGQPILQFSASHSKGVAIVVLTGLAAIGVDLEVVRALPDLPALVATTFTGSERLAWQRLPASRQMNAFFECWARKEAYLKGTGEGLQKVPDQVHVAFDAARWDEPIPVFEQDRQVSDWELHSLSTPSQALAVAVEAPAPRLLCWDWSCA